MENHSSQEELELDGNRREMLYGPDHFNPAELLHIVIVACGSLKDQKDSIMDTAKRQLDQSKALINSALILTKKKLQFHIVVDDPDIFESLEQHVSTMSDEYRRKILMTEHMDWYPPNRENVKEIMRSCATELLFLPFMFPDINQIVYIDTDAVFLRPPEHIFQNFDNFNTDQFISMTYVGWKYPTKNIPVYKGGFNSGVVMMDIQKIRRPEINWLNRTLEIIDLYEGRPSKDLMCGDQDILNIFLYSNPQHYYDLPCTWNFRWGNCLKLQQNGRPERRKKQRFVGGTLNCELAATDGVALVHGNTGIFNKDTSMKLRQIHETFLNFSMSTQRPSELVTVLKQNMEKKFDYRKSQCDGVKGFNDMVLKWPTEALWLEYQ